MIATCSSAVIGMIVGAVAGFFGGWLDNVLMRVVDVLFAIPFLFMILVVLDSSARRLAVAHPHLRAIRLAGTRRLVRSLFLSLREA